MENGTQCLTVTDFKEQGVYVLPDWLIGARFRLFTYYKGTLSFQDYHVNDYKYHPLPTLHLPAVWSLCWNSCSR